jgi:hypothetical protein
VLRVCTAPGCSTLTLGRLCIGHEPPVEPRRYARGRPYRLKEREVAGTLVASSAARQEPGVNVVLLEGAS